MYFMVIKYRMYVNIYNTFRYNFSMYECKYGHIQMTASSALLLK